MNALAALALALIAQAAPPQPLPFNPPGAQAPEPPRPQAPEPHQSIAVRPQNIKEPSFFSRATKAVGRAVTRLWEKDEPHATAGNLASLNGDVDGALKQYDEAQKQIAPNSDQAATLAFDRSTALLKGQPDQASKALEEARSAQASGDASLRAKAAYNTGVALEAEGKPDEAIKAYAHALSLDSEDVDSKINLELLLQDHEKQQKQAGGQQDKDKKPQPQKDKSDQQQQAQGKQDQEDKKDQQKPDDKKDKGDDKDQQAKDQQDKSDQQKQAEADQKKKDEKGQQGQEQEQPDEQGEKKKDQAKQEQASIGRSEAQRLLDAARAGEKNLQMWRFGKKADQRKSRTAAEKDW